MYAPNHLHYGRYLTSADQSTSHFPTLPMNHGERLEWVGPLRYHRHHGLPNRDIDVQLASPTCQ